MSMDESKPPRTPKDVIEELQALRKASEESFQAYTAIQKRLLELQAKLDLRPDGTLRVKGNE